MNYIILRIWTIILIFWVLMGTVFNCERNKAVGPDTTKPEPKPIWQEIEALDTLQVFYVAANASGSVFASTTTGYKSELFRSTDHGKTWTFLLSRYSIGPMGFMPNGNIFACHVSEISGNPLLRSTDNGETWEVLSSYPGQYPNAFVFHPSDNLFVGDLGPEDIYEGDIYRSADNGDTWQETSFPDTIGVYSMLMNDKGDMFAGTDEGVYRSCDAGETWIAVNHGLEESGKLPHVPYLAINPVNHHIFLSTYSSKIYRSTDHGDSWELTQNFSNKTYSLVINSEGKLFIALIYKGGVFYSMDNGDSWKEMNSGLSSLKISSLAIDSSGFLYAGSGSGLFRTIESTME